MSVKKIGVLWLRFFTIFPLIIFFQFEISVAAIDQTIAKLPYVSTGALQKLGVKYAARLASEIPLTKEPY